jgi:hypothetical protein
MPTYYWVMTIIAVILLLIHWRGRNAVWGGATIGIIVGIIISIIKGNWSLLAFVFSIGTYIGTLFEWIFRLTKKFNKR